jgi:hypothetical protein
MTKDSEDTDTTTKRPSTYRYTLCSFCKQRHPEPTGDSCMMALLDKTEKGESSGAKPKRPPLITVPEGDPDVDSHAERSQVLPQPGGAEGGGKVPVTVRILGTIHDGLLSQGGRLLQGFKV